MKKFAVFASSLIIFLGLLVVIYPAKKPSPLDTRFLNAINQKQPKIVLLGDSMLGEGIDNELFSRLVNQPSYKIAWGGSASAFWYLIIKNEICAATYKPQYILLFYRDTNLTDPTFRIDGEYRKALRLFSLPQEDLVSRLAYNKNMSFLEILLNTYFPPYAQQDKIKENLDKTIKYLLPGILLGKDPAQVDKAVDAIINDQNMDPELFTQSQLRFEEFNNPTSTNFDKQINGSFLPEMIRLTKENGIELILVRVKRRSIAENKRESRSVTSYIQSLNNYLDLKGIKNFDFTDHEEIMIQHFGEGDHLNSEGKTLFTKLLAKKILQINTIK
jgi:hypothetical protein